MVSHWSLYDSNSPRVSRTLLSSLADLNIPVVWMIPTRPLISKSSSPCRSLLVTVPRALITIGFTVTFMFHSFFNSLARSRYYYYYYFTPGEFSHQRLLMFFHEFSRVSRTLLSILVDLNNAVVLIVLGRLLISNASTIIIIIIIQLSASF